MLRKDPAMLVDATGPKYEVGKPGKLLFWWRWCAGFYWWIGNGLVVFGGGDVVAVLWWCSCWSLGAALVFFWWYFSGVLVPLQRCFGGVYAKNKVSQGIFWNDLSWKKQLLNSLFYWTENKLTILTLFTHYYKYMYIYIYNIYNIARYLFPVTFIHDQSC